MKKKLKNLILAIFIAGTMLLLTSCGTTRVEYNFVPVIDWRDIPDFPALNYYAESEDGNYITVDSFWFRAIAEFKVRILDIQEVLRRTEEEKDLKNKNKGGKA